MGGTGGCFAKTYVGIEQVPRANESEQLKRFQPAEDYWFLRASVLDCLHLLPPVMSATIFLQGFQAIFCGVEISHMASPCEKLEYSL